MPPRLTEPEVRDALRTVVEPELGKNLVELDAIKSVRIGAADAAGPTDGVRLGVELMTPAYLHKEALRAAIVKAVSDLGASHVEVDFSADVKSRVGALARGRLPGVRNVLAIASGKGGVGKSTVATNVALALRRHGARVGLLDADIYGPSVPQMLGRPASEAAPSPAGDHKITPAEHHGIKVMSVGFFVAPGEAVVWRGPMIHKLLQQFIDDASWGELDYLVVDLPPGTGDAQLSLAQLVPLAGAVMVTTPQEVAVIDVVKGIAMFRKVEVPILGIVENMSYYVCPACGHHDEIFSRGGGRRLAEREGVELLAEIPIDAKVRYGGDAGVPVVVGAPESEHAKIFLELAARVATRLAVMVAKGPRRAAGLVSIS